MENNLNSNANATSNVNITFEDEAKYTDDYMDMLIKLAFDYYDTHNERDKYENSILSFISSYQSSVKVFETKANLKYLIDFIGKYPTADVQFIENSLTALHMKSNYIDLFKKMLYSYSDEINMLKASMIQKMVNHRVLDFSHSFAIKFCDSSSDKVDFLIKIMLRYLDDDSTEKKLEMDLSLNQFYSLFNELQKIDTMIKTLI